MKQHELNSLRRLLTAMNDAVDTDVARAIKTVREAADDITPSDIECTLRMDAIRTTVKTEMNEAERRAAREDDESRSAHAYGMAKAYKRVLGLFGDDDE